MKCPHCDNIFSSISSLNNHIKTARYCISKRTDNKILIFKCSKCPKTFTSKRWLKSHENKCGETIEELQNRNRELITQNDLLEGTVYELKQTIKELQDKLENIAIKAVSRPTTRNTQINNYIQQLKPLTDEHLLDSVSNLTIDHIIKGPEGYAEYALEYPLKDRVLCSDYSRRKVKFKNKDGKVITDPEMTSLASKFFESIKEKNKELICKYANELKEKLGDDNVMDTVVKLFDYKAAVEKGSDGGEKTDFHHDFVRQMCSQTIKE
uniref:C2H2-type domain-containing protein n=1 Tax=viral metagenome TaxID=1070528 RepID=A0A6C0JQF0_9ZZZZ